MYSGSNSKKNGAGIISLVTRDRTGKKIEEKATVPLPLGMFPELCVETLSRLKIKSRIGRNPIFSSSRLTIEIEDWTKLIYAKSVLEGIE